MIPIHTHAALAIKEIKVVELKSAVKEAIEIHRHQFFECFVFLKGGGTHSIDFTEFPIHDFSIHIITPGQVHQLARKANSHGFVFMFELLHFDTQKAIENFLMDHTCFDVQELSPIYLLEPSAEEALKHIVKQSITEFNKEDAFKNQLILHQLSLLLIYCMRLNSQRNLLQEQKHLSTYTAFRRLLMSKFRELKKVKEYALELNISEKLLNEIALQRSGETASSLIFNQSILEAKRLLNTGISTKEVAYELNFNDPAHFSKFFKSQTGISPTEFKSIHE